MRAAKVVAMMGVVAISAGLEVARLPTLLACSVWTAEPLVCSKKEPLGVRCDTAEAKSLRSLWFRPEAKITPKDLPLTALPPFTDCFASDEVGSRGIPN